LTGWEEFINANLNTIYNRLKNKVIFDGRNIFRVEDMRKRGFDYICFGSECIYNHSLYAGETAVSNSGVCTRD
jgi:UDPglucose 6-dehydrogenase